jgi:cardiolipin synthase
MKYRFFTNSKKAWANMYEAISLAESSIFFEMYIFEDNTVGFDFITLLADKAKSGIKVKILLDAFGSLGLPKERVSALQEAGVEVLFFSHFLHRVHRKILVVDNKVAFMGGVNVHQGAVDWRRLSS